MKKAMGFGLAGVFVCFILCLMAGVSVAQTPGVTIQGPAELTALMAQAVKEQRPGLEVRTDERSDLKNRVWMSGPGGADYIPLSPARKKDMRDASSTGKSVYLVLCGDQKHIFDRLIGPPPVAMPPSPPVERERVVRERVVVQQQPVTVPVYLDRVPMCPALPACAPYDPYGGYVEVPYPGYPRYYGGYYGGYWGRGWFRGHPRGFGGHPYHPRGYGGHHPHGGSGHHPHGRR